MAVLRDAKYITVLFERVPNDIDIFKTTSLESLDKALLSLRFLPRISENRFVQFQTLIYSAFLSLKLDLLCPQLDFSYAFFSQAFPFLWVIAYRRKIGRETAYR